MTELFGRDEDLAELRAAVRESRLVSIVGPVGVGKTRLAQRLLDGEPHASVDLSERTSVLGLRAEVARALDAPAKHLEEALGGRLLLLDNLEQLVEEAAAQIAAWLDAAPDLSIVATSRRRLAISAERVFELRPLSPDASRTLFVARVRQADRDYAPDEKERAAIARICVELDHLPLAIELAAARARWMSAQELLERLSDRFAALAAGPRDAPARHASLEGAIASAWAALDDDAQAILAQCALFEGGFDLAAADAILEAGEASVLDALGELVDRSLLVRERTGGQTRYRLLASVRAYARGQGAPAGGVDRHARYYLAQGFRMADRYERRRAPEELAWLVREDANLRAVFRRARQAGDRGRALDAALALQPVLLARGPAKLRLRVLDGALEEADELDPVKTAWARLARGDTLDRLGRRDEAREEIEAGLALAERADDARLIAVASWRLGASREDPDAQREAFERALSIVRRAGDRYHEGRVLSTYGAAALERGALDEAERLLDEAERAHADAEDDTYRATTRGLRGRLAHRRGDLEEARGALREAIDAHLAMDNRRWLAQLWAELGLVQLEIGALEAARAAHAEAARRALGRAAPAVALLGALLAEEDHDDEAAARGFGEAMDAARGAVRAAGVLGRLRVSGEGTPPDEPPFDALGAAHRGLAEGAWDDAALDALGSEPSPLARLAARSLRRALDEASADALVLGPEAGWFRWGGGEAVDLSRRAAPRRILEALAETHADPSRRWSLEALFSRGWPGEKALEKAAASRVYVAVSTLRKAGLEEVLEKDDAGYRLRPDVRLLRAARGELPK